MISATRADVEAAVELLKAAKQSWRPRPNTVDTWWALLSDLEADLLLRAAKRLGQEHRGHPDVEVLRRFAGEERDRLKIAHAQSRDRALQVLALLQAHVEQGGELKTADSGAPDERIAVLAWVAGMRAHIEVVTPGEPMLLSDADLDSLRGWQSFFVAKASKRPRPAARVEQGALFAAGERRAS